MAVESRLKPNDILARFDHLSSRFDVHLPRLRDIADLAWPAKSDILRGTEDWRYHDEARDRTWKLYDSTAARARRLLAGNIQSAVTNPAIAWFRFRFRDEGLNEDYEVAPWMQAVSRTMLDAYNSSNFYTEAFQHYAQLGVFGTACTYIGQRQDLWYEEGLFALRFQTQYPGSYVIADGPHGRVDTVMRRLKFTPRQALALWKQDAPARVKRIMSSPSYTSAMDDVEPYVHVVQPRTMRDLSRAGQARHMPWVDAVIDATDREVVTEQGWEEFPFVVSRWEREDTSAWGYGPGHEALPDMQTLNLLVEDWLHMLELRVKPPLEVLSPALLQHVRFAPLALNLVEQSGSINPLNIQGDANGFITELARLQKQIRDAFHVDDLLALPPVDGAGRMTATEVVQRISLMAQYLGPVFTMLLADYLDPMADRIFGLGLRAEIFPPIPLAVLEAAARTSGGQIDVEYEGPLARSQRSHEVQAYDDMLTLGLRTAEATGSQDVWDNVDLDVGFRDSSLALGIRRDVLRDPRVRDRIRRDRQQQVAQAQQAALLNQEAQTLRQGAAGVRELSQVAA